jgi:hypothetical protein
VPEGFDGSEKVDLSWKIMTIIYCWKEALGLNVTAKPCKPAVMNIMARDQVVGDAHVSLLMR